MKGFTNEWLQAHHARRAASSAEPQPAVCHDALAAKKGEAQYAGRVRVCVTGFRRRLLDPCNFCTKYFVDCLRYAHIIADDRLEDISLEVRQIKVKTKADERTEIEIENL